MNDNLFQAHRPEEELEKARRFLARGKIKKGERILRELIKEFPNFFPARLELADFLLEMAFPYEALDILRQGRKINSENLDLCYLYGVALQKCWFLNLAEKEFQEIKNQRPNDKEVLRQIGWTKVLKGEFEQGRKLLREAINLDLMNPLAYIDLGASYAMTLDFAEGLNWMETARNLESDKPIIQERIKKTKRMEREFAKFSENDKRKMQEMRNDPQQLKLMAIETMLLMSQDNPLLKEDYEDLQKELKLTGVSHKMRSFKAPKTKDEKTVMEYMDYHYKVPDVDKKISRKEFEMVKKKLLNSKIKEKEIKKLLLILAHQGTKEAVKLLEDYSEKAPGELKDWVELSLGECKMFSQAKPGQVVKIIH